MSDDDKRDGVRVGDVEIVLRRAAELEARTADHDVLPDADVKQLAGDIGITGEAVERALVELRSGALVRRERPRGLSERLWDPPQVVAARTVPGPLEEVQEIVYDFLTAQGFEVKRDFGTKRVWRREESAWKSLRAMFDASRKRLEGSGPVTTSIAAADGGAVDVVLTVDLAELRSSGRASAWGGGLLFGGLSLGAGAAGAAYAALFWLPIGAVAAAGIAYAITRGAVSSYRKQAALLEENVEGFLDEVERRRR